MVRKIESISVTVLLLASTALPAVAGKNTHSADMLFGAPRIEAPRTAQVVEIQQPSLPQEQPMAQIESIDYYAQEAALTHPANAMPRETGANNEINTAAYPWLMEAQMAGAALPAHANTQVKVESRVESYARADRLVDYISNEHVTLPDMEEKPYQAAALPKQQKTVADEQEVALGEPALNASDLSEVRGTGGIDTGTLNILDAINANNTTNNNVTGSNIINSDAFTNASGLVSLIQNSGNNVIIQSATIVNFNAK